MAERPYEVLFLCTGNSARSIFAESLLSHIAPDRLRAHSAGSHPKGAVHPLTLRVLHELGHETAALRSKSWDEFAEPGAPALDFVFTVCDNAAGETCPVWPGQPVTAHWGVEDPAVFVGTEEARLNAFRLALVALERRIRLFASLPIESLDRMSLQREVEAIGKSRV
ncbi:MAG TPA: arsenate reductase ArsC [Myxococcota bacterium]|nr:arsenate reductase ArsC [Myxococcota bacterium]